MVGCPSHDVGGISVVAVTAASTDSSLGLKVGRGHLKGERAETHLAGSAGFQRLCLPLD